MNMPRFNSAAFLFLVGVFTVAQDVPEAIAASGSLNLSTHSSTESSLLQEQLHQQVSEPRQRELYEACITSANRVERNAHAMMPSRLWTFDDEKFQRQLDRLRLAESTLSQNQSAFEASLTPQQVSTFNPELLAIHELKSQMEYRIQSLDNQLRNHQAAKWKIAEDTTAFQDSVRSGGDSIRRSLGKSG